MIAKAIYDENGNITTLVFGGTVLDGTNYIEVEYDYDLPKTHKVINGQLVLIDPLEL